MVVFSESDGRLRPSVISSHLPWRIWWVLGECFREAGSGWQLSNCHPYHLDGKWYRWQLMLLLSLPGLIWSVLTFISLWPDLQQIWNRRRSFGGICGTYISLNKPWQICGFLLFLTLSFIQYRHRLFIHTFTHNRTGSRWHSPLLGWLIRIWLNDTPARTFNRCYLLYCDIVLVFWFSCLFPLSLQENTSQHIQYKQTKLTCGASFRQKGIN